MNKTTTRTLLASAVFGLAVSAGPAQADMFAESYLTIENFLFLDDQGAVLDYNDDFVADSLVFTSSADMDGTLTGAGGGTFSYVTANTSDGVDYPTVLPAGTTTVNAPTTCVGDCGGAAALLIQTDNTFPMLTGAQVGNFVAADQQQVGAPIANLPGFTQVGADVSGGSYASLTSGNATGSSNVNNGLQSQWQFILAADQAITFNADFRVYIEAFAGAGELLPGKAEANVSFNISVTDIDENSATFGQVLYSFAPGVLNDLTAANANGFAVDLQTCGQYAGLFGGCGTELAGILDETTPLLPGLTTLQLAIRGNNNVDISRVEGPEPSVLALLGLGFLGMSLGRRRRRA